MQIIMTAAKMYEKFQRSEYRHGCSLSTLPCCLVQNMSTLNKIFLIEPNQLTGFCATHGANKKEIRNLMTSFIKIKTNPDDVHLDLKCFGILILKPKRELMSLCHNEVFANLIKV